MRSLETRDDVKRLWERVHYVVRNEEAWDIISEAFEEIERQAFFEGSMAALNE